MHFVKLQRREFIALLGCASAELTAWPLAARAQQSVATRHVVVLMGLAPNDSDVLPRLKAFRQRLQELRWIENRNLEITCGAQSASGVRFPPFQARVGAQFSTIKGPGRGARAATSRRAE